MAQKSTKVRRVWTEDELDDALLRLGEAAAASEPNGTGPEDAGDELRPVVGAGRFTRRRQAPVAPAAAAAVAVCVGVALAGQHGGVRPAHAAEVLATAADAAASTGDPGVPAGTYRYVYEDGWYSNEMNEGTRYYAALDEQRVETWIPADMTGTWTQRITDTGRRRWLTNEHSPTEPHAHKGTRELHAVCGDWEHPKAVPACSAKFDNGWGWPTPSWLASLPRDPEALYQRLRHDAGGRPAGELDLAVQALESGVLPADVRAALYRAMGRIPGIDVTAGYANLDGTKGVAFGLPAGRTGYRRDVIVDPHSGRFIGERDVVTRPFHGIAAGTVMSYTAVRFAVVDAAGVRPR